MQAYDPSLVNKHHCTINANSDTLRFFSDLHVSLKLLNQSKYSAAQKLLLRSLKQMDERGDGDVPDPAHWVALNAVGVSMSLGGRYQEADSYLRRALVQIETLSNEGLSQDAYADIAGCLGDLAANNIKSRSGKDVEAFHLLKRALYMSERAYRPNHTLIESSQSLLPLAILAQDPQRANLLAHKMLDSNSCMQRLLFNTEQVKVAEPGAARSLGMLASVVVETDQTDTAVRIAAAARQATAQHCGEGSADHARAVMTLARAHFLAGRR